MAGKGDAKEHQWFKGWWALVHAHGAEVAWDVWLGRRREVGDPEGGASRFEPPLGEPAMPEGTYRHGTVV